MARPTIKQLFGSVAGRFRKDKAGDTSLTFHFILSGPEEGTYTIQITNGECLVAEGLQGTADCTITTGSDTYIGLETGEINPQEALMGGKVQVSNIMHMLSFAKLFGKYNNNPEPVASKGFKTLPEGPLNGVRVLDFSRLLPGPLATLFMADMGAEVIKVEDVQSPDYIRNFPPFVNGQSAYYSALNAGKYSVALSFNADKVELLELIKTADVLVEQYRPGIMDSMGLGYQAISQINPRIIYVSITGYGQTGPLAQVAGHDINYMAEAGLLGLNLDENGKPVIPGFQLADIGGGSYTALSACLAALFERERTGKGKHLDISMTEAIKPLLALPAASFKAQGETIKELAGHIANYNIYNCSDNKFIALGALEPKFWSLFCKAIAKLEWENRIADLSDEAVNTLKNELTGVFATNTSDYWQNLGLEYDMCITVVKELKDATGPLEYPVKFITGASTAGPAPELGQDNSLFL